MQVAPQRFIYTGNLQLRAFSRGQFLAAAVMSSGALAAAVPFSASSTEPLANQVVEAAPPPSFETFLDRLMAAESEGRSHAKNPRSSALGPFQFIKRTFLDISRRHFQAETAGLSQAEILLLRSDRDLSRRAAAAFCKENVTYLRERGHEPTFAHLRLAFLLGPADATRVMQAQQHASVPELLSPSVIKANPFMRSMSVADLLAKSERDVNRGKPEGVVTVPQLIVRPRARARPLTVQATVPQSSTKRCDGLAACRKFSALSRPPSKGRKI